MKRSRILLTAFALLALMLCCGCNPAVEKPDGPHIVKGDKITIPEWAESGQHHEFPEDSWFFSTTSHDGAHAPSMSRLYDLLAKEIHEELSKSLKDLLPTDLQAPLERGRWVSLRMIPQLKCIYKTWTNGKSSAAFMALSKSELRDFCSEVSPPLLPATDSVNEFDMDALSVFSFRTQRLVAAIERLTLMALRSPKAEIRNPDFDKALDDLRGAKAFLKAFRNELQAILSGGNRRLMIGEKPKSPIALTIKYQGEGTPSLPLEPMLDGINADGRVVDADVQTNTVGTALISFRRAIRFAGKEDLYIGFRLDPDKLSPLVISGVQFAPWLARITLPAKTNVTVLLRINAKTVKLKDSSPFRDALEKRIRSRLPVTSDPATAKRSGNYVLEITANLAMTRLPRPRGVSQMRAAGALILRHQGGSTLASMPVEGFADIRDDDVERAEREALENLWYVHAEKIRKELRRAFPPIME